jgi:tetratricopeptide (TPR) repeat protein
MSENEMKKRLLTLFAIEDKEEYKEFVEAIEDFYGKTIAIMAMDCGLMKELKTAKNRFKEEAEIKNIPDPAPIPIPEKPLFETYKVNSEGKAVPSSQVEIVENTQNLAYSEKYDEYLKEKEKSIEAEVIMEPGEEEALAPDVLAEEEMEEEIIPNEVIPTNMFYIAKHKDFTSENREEIEKQLQFFKKAAEEWEPEFTEHLEAAIPGWQTILLFEKAVSQYLATDSLKKQEEFDKLIKSIPEAIELQKQLCELAQSNDKVEKTFKTIKNTLKEKAENFLNELGSKPKIYGMSISDNAGKFHLENITELLKWVSKWRDIPAREAMFGLFNISVTNLNQLAQMIVKKGTIKGIKPVGFTVTVKTK